MKADTQTVSIQSPAGKVVRFLADPANLPRWAVGFAKAVRRDGERWYVGTAAGEMAIRVAAEARTGVVDYLISPAPGVEVLAASRVIPRGPGCEYTFTQFQGPGMSDEAFGQSVKALSHELTVLKALMEVECPL
jgi:hypothetical protein